jgi:competence protein ComEC
MDKSLKHWKSEHPMLFISCLLMTGAFIAEQIPAISNPLLNSIHYKSSYLSVFIFLWTVIVLLLLQTNKNSHWLHGLLICIIIILWGVGIAILTKQYSLLSIPYPEGFIQTIRSSIIQKLNKTIPHKTANAFAQAMLIGIKGEMDKSIVKAYTQLGIIHIIAISGMHLEIIYQYLAQFTKWLPRKLFFRWLEFFMLLIGIWFYTFVAFASPSIVRATVFFSIYLIGRMFNLHQYTLNSIAAGLLVVVLFDHSSINQIGLQLSYAAVIGIHLFYPILYDLNKMDNPILNFCWSNLSITMAAQITTLPILIFHFHQVSGLVIISNFIMVPLSTVLLYVLLMLLLTPYYFNLPILLGKAIQAYMIWLNHIVSLVYQLSPYEAPVFQMSKWGLCIYYVYMLLIYLWILKKQARILFVAILIATIQICLKLFSLH